MIDTLIHPQVRSVIEADHGILEQFGMSVQLAMDGVCEISTNVPVSLVNAAGFAHGSIAFALLDTACAYALGSIELRGVTISANTTYVKGAQAGSIMSTKVVVASHSRRVASLRGEVFIEADGQPELAAHGTFVFQLLEART